MESVAAPAPRKHVLGVLVLALTAGFLLLAAPASPSGNGAAGCGKVIKANFTLSHDLLNCPGNGLEVGANGITLDLNGKTIDGVSIGAGVVNNGFDRVTIRNGRIQGFNYGVWLNPGTNLNILTGLTVTGSEYAGVQLTNADWNNRIRRNLIELQAGEGVAIAGGSSGNVVSDNTIRTNEANGVYVLGSSGNRIVRNKIMGNSDRNIRLDKSHKNHVLRNTIARGGDAAVELTDSNRNVLARNKLSTSGDAGFILSHSDGNRLLANTATSSSDAGAFLQFSNNNTLRKNAFFGNPAGIDLAHAHGNIIESNAANANMGNGINLEDSNGNRIRANIANGNRGAGIYVVGEATEAGDPNSRGNVVIGNSVSGNGGGGVAIESPGHTLRNNRAFSNSGWGIFTVAGTLGLTGNFAGGNGKLEQCYGIACVLRAPPVTRKPKARATRRHRR
jgi:parallel beta-helix repeat protein